MNFLDENGLGRLWAQIILKLNSKVPDGGTTGQVLKKTETGTEWADESGGSSSTTQTITLLTSGWAQSSSGYSQTVNVTAVTASSNG